MLAVLGLVLVLSTAAAASPSGAGLEQLWALPIHAEPQTFTTYGVDGRHVYLAERDGAEVTLTARRLADGAVSWQTSLSEDAPERMAVQAVHGTPAVTLYPDWVSVGDGEIVTSGHDPQTGRRLWRFRGEVIGELDDGSLLVSRRIPVDLGPEARQVFRFDPVAGEATRSVTVIGAHMTHWQEADGTVWLSSLASDGELRRYDLLAETSASVATPYAAPEQGMGHRLLHSNGRLLVEAHGQAGPAVVAYDPVTLTEQWRAAPAEQARTCGASVCVRVPGQAGRMLQALDPGMGQPRWTLGPGSSVVAGWDGRLWVRREAADRPGGAGSLVIDSATGRRLTTANVASAWRLADPGGGSRLLLSSQELRAHGLGHGPRRDIWWAYAGPGLVHQELLGAVEANTCRLHRPHLVCSVAEEAVTVWRLPVAGGR